MIEERDKELEQYVLNNEYWHEVRRIAGLNLREFVRQNKRLINEYREEENKRCVIPV